MKIDDDIHAHEEAFLALARQASQAYDRFVYEDANQAEAVARLLFRAGAAEFSSPFGRILIEGSAVQGMLAWLPARELAKRRMSSAMVMHKAGVFQSSCGLERRLSLAGRTLLRPRPEDAYLSRVAVAHSSARRGLGTLLLQQCVQEAAANGAERLILEVAADNHSAIRFYEAEGFEHIGGKAVTDEETARTLSYLHFAKVLPR